MCNNMCPQSNERALPAAAKRDYITHNKDGFVSLLFFSFNTTDLHNIILCMHARVTMRCCVYLLQSEANKSLSDELDGPHPNDNNVVTHIVV